jgi:aspartyl-tRNA(Asn)/glutamyl-tRNA(Gln) amidotransferase subunit A
MSELARMGVAELARRLRRREISAREATQAVLRSLEAHGQRLVAVARLRADEALAEAERADAEAARGDFRGPLHGVPLAHKDMFYRQGELAECGTRILRGHRADRTATVIARLDRAGALDLGRLNMVEFALGVTGHNAHTGTPRNPWNPAYITGGSTSGGAALVGAHALPATLGSDTGGSIRIPAAHCGLVGIKPTYGRASRWGCMPLSPSLDTIGPLARSALDCALLLNAIAGHDPRDPSTSTRPVRDVTARIGRDLAGIRVGWLTGDLEAPLDPEVDTMSRAATLRLAEAGARVEQVRTPDFAPLNALRRTLMLPEAAALHRHWVQTRRHDYVPQTLARMLPGFVIPAADHVRALAARGTILRRYVQTVFAAADVVALPTSPTPCVPIAASDTGGDARFVQLANAMGGLVGPFNYLGLPAVSVPVGRDRAGLPVGLQLVGRPFSEPLLLQVADAWLQLSGGIGAPPAA